MTTGQKYRMILKSANEYRYKMPHDVDKVELVKTGKEDYPEIVEISWKSGGKSGIGNKEAIEVAKPLLNDFEALRTALIELANKQMKALEPEAKMEAEKERPWTYILGVMRDGVRVQRYSWFEDNSWELFGNTDEELLNRRISNCRDFRSESTRDWHVYKRMRGSTELKEIF